MELRFSKGTASKAHDCIPSQAFGKVSGMSKGMVPPNCTGNFMVLLSKRMGRLGPDVASGYSM